MPDLKSLETMRAKLQDFPLSIYTVLVEKRQDKHYAVTWNGTKLGENFDCSALLTTVIAAYSGQTDISIMVKDPVTLPSAVTFSLANSSLIFLGTVTATAGGIVMSGANSFLSFRTIDCVKYLNKAVEITATRVKVVGETITRALEAFRISNTFCDIYCGYIVSCYYGVWADSCTFGKMQFVLIDGSGCPAAAEKGIILYPDAGGKTTGENNITFAVLENFTIGIAIISSAGQFQEGNRIVGSIFACSYSGLYITGSDAQLGSFSGCIDCVASGGQDIIETSGPNTYYMNYYRAAFKAVHVNSLMYGFHA